MGLSVAEGWDKVEIGMEDESSYSENFCELSLSLIYIEHCSYNLTKFVPFRFVCFFINFNNNNKNIISEENTIKHKCCN